MFGGITHLLEAQSRSQQTPHPGSGTRRCGRRTCWPPCPEGHERRVSVTAQPLGRGQRTSTNLRSQDEGLHELPHGLHVVGQLAHHLHHHALVQGGVGVHVPDLGVAVAEAQGHHPLVDLLQTTQHLRASLLWKT